MIRAYLYSNKRIRAYLYYNKRIIAYLYYNKRIRAYLYPNNITVLNTFLCISMWNKYVLLQNIHCWNVLAKIVKIFTTATISCCTVLSFVVILTYTNDLFHDISQAWGPIWERQVLSFVVILTYINDLFWDISQAWGPIGERQVLSFVVILTYPNGLFCDISQAGRSIWERQAISSIRHRVSSSCPRYAWNLAWRNTPEIHLCARIVGWVKGAIRQLHWIVCWRCTHWKYEPSLTLVDQHCIIFGCLTPETSTSILVQNDYLREKLCITRGRRVS